MTEEEKEEWQNHFLNLGIEVTAHDCLKIPFIVTSTKSIDELRNIRDIIEIDGPVPIIVQLSNYASCPSIHISFHHKQYECMVNVDHKIYKDAGLIKSVKWKRPDAPKTITDKHVIDKYFFNDAFNGTIPGTTYFTQSGGYRIDNNSERFRNILFLETEVYKSTN